MEDNQGNQDGSAKEENGKTTTEGQSEMNQPQEEDPVKRAFQNALNQNVAASELDTPERVVTDGHAMTARDDGQQQSPQQEGAAEGGPSADKAPPSDDADDTTPGPAGTPGAQGTQGASPVSAPSPGQAQAIKKLAKTAMQEREMTAMDENNRAEQPSSDTGVSSEETVTTQAAVPQTKKKSTKRKKKKKKKTQTMAPPPFYQFPFFGLLPQVQAQERRKRAKKKSATRDDPAHAAPAKAAPAPAPPPPAPEPPAPKKLEAMKIQQKEDDNGYLNLADLQAEEKKLYGEEKKIGAPGEEYICLAEANEAAAPASSGSGSKDNTNSAPLGGGSGSGKAGKPPEPAKSPAAPGAAKSPLTKEEFQDAVLTPRPGAHAKPAPGSKTPPPKETKKTSLTNDASLSRKTRDKKAAVGGGVPPRPGAPVTPRPASPHPHQQPAPVTSVGPNRHKTVRHATKEGPDAKTPQKGQPTKRKAAPPVMPVRPPTQMDKKGVVQYPVKKASATKDEFQDAVLTPVNKNPPNNKGGGTRR